MIRKVNYLKLDFLEKTNVNILEYCFLSFIFLRYMYYKMEVVISILFDNRVVI